MSDRTNERKVKIMIQVGLCVIGLIVFIGTSIIMNHKQADLQSAIEKQSLQADDLQNEIATENIVESATGLDQSRVSRDDKIAEEFISDIMTWSDGETYDKNREKLMELVGEDNEIFESFMPENVKYQDLNYIDTHSANSKYEGMESYVTDIDGDKYSYIALVTWSTTMANVEGEAQCLFQYTIDGEGNITDLNAFTLSE